MNLANEQNGLDPRFKKIVALGRSTEHEGEKRTAHNMAETMAKLAGMTFEQADRLYPRGSQQAAAMSAPPRPAPRSWPLGDVEQALKEFKAGRLKISIPMGTPSRGRRDTSPRAAASPAAQPQAARGKPDNDAAETERRRASDEGRKTAEARMEPTIPASNSTPVRDIASRKDYESRAASVNRHFDLIVRADVSAQSHRIKAGQELIALRADIEPGKWIEWCKANIKRGPRDIQRVMRIAGAADPIAAQRMERDAARGSMARSRAPGFRSEAQRA